MVRDEGLEGFLNGFEHGSMLRDAVVPGLLHDDAARGGAAFDEDAGELGTGVLDVLLDLRLHPGSPSRVAGLGLELQVGAQAVVDHRRELLIQDLVAL